ncbi:hypothetical protein H9P43_005225 [Blastocladiella emersonii ATCC 22665]|nr:hypothetical protein H9P43_005225 [Blastocladiella emersonii ATCC 22665]
MNHFAQRLNTTALLPRIEPGSAEDMIQQYPIMLGWPGLVIPLVFGLLQYATFWHSQWIKATAMACVKPLVCCGALRNKLEPEQDTKPKKGLGTFFTLYIVVSLVMEFAKAIWLLAFVLPKNPTPFGEPRAAHFLVVMSWSLHGIIVVLSPKFVSLLSIEDQLETGNAQQDGELPWWKPEPNEQGEAGFPETGFGYVLVAVNLVYLGILGGLVLHSVLRSFVAVPLAIAALLAPLLVPLLVSASHNLWPSFYQVFTIEADTMRASIVSNTHAVAAGIALVLTAALKFVTRFV